MPPYVLAASAYIAFTLASSATSTWTANASPASAAVRSAASPSTSATQTFAPSEQKSRAASRPIPPPAPVITQTLLSSRPLTTQPPCRRARQSRRHEDVLDLGVAL